MLTQLIVVFLTMMDFAVHEINMAIFEIDFIENQIELSIRFDKDDLEYALSSYKGEQINNLKAIKHSLPQYILHTIQIG